ncbi:hypothetical protein [Phyllobacterium chamaecytisi]|nr:hypothetical protein [Phyllobacterium sp. KW56]
MIFDKLARITFGLTSVLTLSAFGLIAYAACEGVRDVLSSSRDNF